MLLEPPGNFFRADLQNLAVFDHDAYWPRRIFFENCMHGLTKAQERVMAHLCKFFFAHDSAAFVICSTVDEAMLTSTAIAAEPVSQPIR